MKKISLILGITILFAGCAPKPQQTAPKQAEWARGADLSWLSEMEHDGMLFYEPTETPSGEKESVDCISLLSSLGMNAVRLRVWVNHKTGWSNLPDMLGLAQRVSKEGLRLMVDIHYSDFFADPSHQAIPEAWLSYDYDALCEAVRNHTIDVLTALKNAGIEPEWVQIGNETPNGMLWPVARLVDKDDNSNGCWDRYAGLTATGYKAAKEVFPDITVIVHVDNAYERRDWFWQAMKEHGGLWDMIGLSHYPMMSAWNGGKSWQEMNDLAEANIRHLIGEWQCPVMVAEIGMFNGNALSDTVMADFVRRATAIDSCAGIFYWEPECYGGWRPAEYIPLGWGSYDMGAFTDEGQPSNVMKILLTSEP
ncbi:MAG: glycosyl hydrolase 53 family protein [Paludibacteraceae bacterium]|nr:glycosyl hydrolase 53 family protein [Paludibacteraceae bacterium]